MQQFMMQWVLPSEIRFWQLITLIIELAIAINSYVSIHTLLCPHYYQIYKHFCPLQLDATSGTTPDHAYGQYNIPVAYTVEMRGNGVYGSYGFVLPPTFILINSEEIFKGVMAMIPVARQNGLL
jgi:Zinc carboxypeptidase